MESVQLGSSNVMTWLNRYRKRTVVSKSSIYGPILRSPPFTFNGPKEKLLSFIFQVQVVITRFLLRIGLNKPSRPLVAMGMRHWTTKMFPCQLRLVNLVTVTSLLMDHWTFHHTWEILFWSLNSCMRTQSTNGWIGMKQAAHIALRGFPLML